MRRLNPRWLGAVWFIAVLALLTCMFIASFFLTAYIFGLANLHPSPLWVQVVNSVLGLCLAGVVIAAVGKMARSLGWIGEVQVFGPIIEAIEKIAKGDFSTRVDNELRENQMVSKLANSVNRMAIELDQMEKLRQEFISNVSHEIQSPLTSIRGFAQALENEEVGPEERHHYLSIIETESARLSRITQELLQMASLESDRVRFEPKSYRLDRQIRSLILACEPQWTEKRLDMQVALQEVEITADEDLLSEVWNNLIHNSIKFTPPGGRISIDLLHQGKTVQFSISDNGIGIADGDLPHVFERFYKADKSRTRSNGGSGLGLSITQKIVEIHKGTIRIESRAGAGTTLTVSLPIK